MFEGIIIEESLTDKSVLKDVRVVSTHVSKVTDKHKTPWVKQWTMHTVQIPSAKAAYIADSLSQAIDKAHASSWYADFKNDQEHYVVYYDKVFHITDRADKDKYAKAVNYGRSIGIPERQLDF